MALQQTLPLFSPDVHIVSPRLAILVDDERLVAYSAADPIYSCALDDRDGMRLAAGMLSQMRLAPDTALAEALGVSREMVRRNRNLLVQGGVGAIHSDKRGPRTPYKLKKTARQRAQGPPGAQGRPARAGAWSCAVQQGERTGRTGRHTMPQFAR